MATHETVATVTNTRAPSSSLADVATGAAGDLGVTVDGHLGADGLIGGVTDRPIMCIVGAAVTIDDATYVDPADGTIGTELIHTLHYPGTNPAFRNEAG